MAVTWFRRVSQIVDESDEDAPAVPLHLPLFVSASEHVALLVNPGRFDLLGRKDELLDDGVAAVFGVAGGEAELVGLCFDAGHFTALEAMMWLAERGLKPLL
jgi:hypothetical protein